jgi:hypothetical protein
MQVQIATRLDARLRQRLKIYAAVSGRTVADVVSTALDGYLPAAEDMVREVGGAAALAEEPGAA